MDLFYEAMQYFEQKLLRIEQRIEDNEQLVHLSDRLLELRNTNNGLNSGTNSNAKIYGNNVNTPN